MIIHIILELEAKELPTYFSKVILRKLIPTCIYTIYAKFLVFYHMLALI